MVEVGAVDIDADERCLLLRALRTLSVRLLLLKTDFFLAAGAADGAGGAGVWVEGPGVADKRAERRRGVANRGDRLGAALEDRDRRRAA
jgi:hypothetical protein